MRIHDVSELKQCISDEGCSVQSLIKLTPVNGVNVCELVSVSEMYIFSTCFNFQTIYQVGGLQ